MSAADGTTQTRIPQRRRKRTAQHTHERIHAHEGHVRSLGIHKLTKTRIEKLIQEWRVGAHGDGGNLCLQINSDGRSVSWIFRWRDPKRPSPKNVRAIGLGPYHTVTLEMAREKAAEYRRMLLEGKDPQQERDAARFKADIEAGRAKTVNQVIDEFIPHEFPNLTRESLANVVRDLRGIRDAIGSMPIRLVTRDVLVKEGGLRELREQSGSRAETVRRRLFKLFEYAIGHRYHLGPNPASKAELGVMIPKYVHKPTRRRMLPYTEVPKLLTMLRSIVVQGGGGFRGSYNPPGRRPLSLLCYELALLTGGRVGEGRTMRWRDLENGIWKVRAEEHKTGKLTGVDGYRPITPSMQAIFDEIRTRVPTGPDDYVFPGERRGQPIEKSTIWQRGKATIKKQWLAEGNPDFDLHGFRSTLEGWCTAHEYHPHLWGKQVLHVVGEGSAKHYTQDHQFEPRRKMMARYDEFCNRGEPQDKKKVVQLRKR